MILDMRRLQGMFGIDEDDRMNDEALIIRVARGAGELGEFYLSYVECALKGGSFRKDDLGWIEGMRDWEPLGQVADNARRKQGRKRRATSAQRAYLRGCGFKLWRGISNREAHDLLDSLEQAYEIPPGAWIQQPITDAQIDFLRQLRVGFHPRWTKGEASLAISQRLEELDSRHEEDDIKG
jgi:hypothetical protein